MRDIRDVYPDFEEDRSVSDYAPLLASLEYTLLLKVDAGEYQGDSYILLQDGERYGYLVVGWGSCSGCDALLACESYEDIDALRSQIHDHILWSTRAGLLHFVTTHDWEGDFCSGEEYDAQRSMFTRGAIELLKG